MVSQEQNNGSWVKKHSVLFFFILAYAISWLIELPLILAFWGFIMLPPSIFIIHYLAPLGPLLAALIMTNVEFGGKGIREIVGSMFKWHVQPRWWLVAVISPPLLFAAGIIIDFLIIGVWPNLLLLGFVEYLPYLTPLGVWILWVFTFGLGEETGWRGFALPRLQNKYSALVASLLLSVGWSLWHLPFFFYKADMMGMGPIGITMWVVSLFFGAIFLTWLFNSTEGSILMTAIWHATFNLFTASPIAASGMSAAIMSMILMIWVVIIVIVCKPATLSKKDKQTSKHNKS